MQPLLHRYCLKVQPILIEFVEAGDHVLVVCEVVDAGYLQQGQPMLYTETEDMDNSSQLFN